jgi:membrane protease YdiL (CAAX protease family)
MRTLLKRHDLLVYFMLAYLIPWGGSLLLAAQKDFQPDTLGTAQLAPMFILMLLGPSLASLTLTAVLDGRDGLSNLFGRMRRWRIGWGWSAVVCLTIPIISGTILTALALWSSPVYQLILDPTRVVMGMAVGLLAGLFEETGWTGFALPRLQFRYSTLASGLILGTLWAIWHGMADFWGNIATLGLLWLPNFIFYWLVPLTAYRMLIVWVHRNTDSLLAAQLMHAFYTGTLVVVTPTTPLAEGMFWKALFGMTIWIVLLVVVLKFGDSLAKKSN